MLELTSHYHWRPRRTIPLLLLCSCRGDRRIPWANRRLAGSCAEKVQQLGIQLALQGNQPCCGVRLALRGFQGFPMNGRAYPVFNHQMAAQLCQCSSDYPVGCSPRRHDIGIVLISWGLRTSLSCHGSLAIFTESRQRPPCCGSSRTIEVGYCGYCIHPARRHSRSIHSRPWYREPSPKLGLRAV
jgi:hypothetical protein